MELYVSFFKNWQQPYIHFDLSVSREEILLKYTLLTLKQNFKLINRIPEYVTNNTIGQRRHNISVAC